MSGLVPCKACGGRPKVVDRSDYGHETDWDFAVRCKCGQWIRGKPDKPWEGLLRDQVVELWNQANTVDKEEHGTD